MSPVNGKYAILFAYEAHVTDYDGRFIRSLGFFSERRDATKAAKLHSESPYTDVRDRLTLLIGDEYFLLMQPGPIDVDGVRAAQMKEARAIALAKLSPEDIKALGLEKDDA